MGRLTSDKEFETGNPDRKKMEKMGIKKEKMERNRTGKDLATGTIDSKPVVRNVRAVRDSTKETKLAVVRHLFFFHAYK